MPRYNITNELSLWMLRNHQSPIPLMDVSIHRLNWLQGKGKLILAAYSTENQRVLREFPNGCTIVLHSWKFGPKDNYNVDNIIAEFSDCKLMNLWMRNLMPDDPGELEVMSVYAYISCKVDWYD